MNKLQPGIVALAYCAHWGSIENPEYICLQREGCTSVEFLIMQNFFNIKNKVSGRRKIIKTTPAQA
jgi:hypothetical protein